MLDRYTSMQVFLSLVRRGTFAAAADEIGISRAMASKHIQALEARLGVVLFNRTTRTTRLTEAGERYFLQLDLLLAELDTVERRLGEEAVGVRGTLTIAAPPAYGALRVAPIIAKFMERYPDVRVRLTLADRSVDFVEDGVDIAISTRGELDDSSCVARRLSAVRMIVCAAAVYLAREGRPQQPEDLIRHNCLVYAEAVTRLHAEWQFRRREASFNVRVAGNFASNVGNALRTLAVAGHGVVRLPDYIVSNDLASGALLEILGDFGPMLHPIHALYPQREPLPRKISAFLDFASEALIPLP
ncbi:MAG: LysR substrate-binding domain-containing protein [Gammaproteobacteria bacterium]